MLENSFKKNILIPKLQSLPDCRVDNMPPGYIRAIPDIIGHISGKIFYLEVKKSKSEAYAKSGRVVLQRKYLQERRQEGAFAEFVYPENLEEILNKIKDLAFS